MSNVLLCGLIIAVVLIVLLIAGVPIAVALGISSVLAVLPALSLNVALEVAVLTACQRLFSGISIFTLLAIPFFVLAGNIMNKGGIAVRLINLAKLLTGGIPGSLAHCNIVSNMLFGAVSGSGAAAASAMGSIIGPVEKEEGYESSFAAAVNVATAPTGLLIPPSSALITYSLVSGGTSVAALFMGGYIPGILWGVGCMGVAFFYAKSHGYKTRKEKLSGKEVMTVLWQAFPSILMIIIVIGGIIGGIFTATEGSAIAVVYCLILSVIYKTIDWKSFRAILLDSAKMTGIIVFLIGASNIMAFVMSFTGIPDAISSAILGIAGGKIVIFLVINMFLLFAGTFMDITPAILIFTPIFLPICESFGMSPLQFGIMITYNLCIGTITPPVGNILFVGIRVAKVRLEEVIKPLLPYYAVIFMILMGVTFIPALSTWLPQAVGY